MALLQELKPGVMVKSLLPGSMVTLISGQQHDRLEASASDNAFSDMPLCITRLDKLSRDEQTQDRLIQTERDLVVVDEAHKMTATFFNILAIVEVDGDDTTTHYMRPFQREPDFGATSVAYDLVKLLNKGVIPV